MAAREKFGVDAEAINAALSRHARAAMQISGGKDSVAMLHALRPWWGKITVAWLDTGDAPAETVAQMARIRAMVPNFLHMKSNQPEVIREHGIPLDLLPPSGQTHGWSMHPIARRSQGRYECCNRVLWTPMFEAMREGGFTLWIRGQKNADSLRPSLETGHVDHMGNELLFPLAAWSESEVMDYLDVCGEKIPDYYSYGHSNIDCVTCPAYLTEFDRSGYAAAHDPARLPLLRERISAAVSLMSENAIALMQEAHNIPAKLGTGRSPLHKRQPALNQT